LFHTHDLRPPREGFCLFPGENISVHILNVAPDFKRYLQILKTMKEILIAFAVGIGVGILLAPDKGSETLQKLKDQFDDLLDQASDKGRQFYKEGKSKMRGAADDIAQEAKRSSK
jgi:hypothetical protein